ncbi:MAG: translation elongation factor Ts [Deltaproteobacteria bacterium]|nr:translation elongation factor Ts [Deltaproteobacteria bacterium]
MGEISAKSVKDLRDKTGAGMMDCKRALGDADGDVEKAVELLRERGLAKAGKRGGRATSEGAVSISIDGPVAAMVEVGCETDFVARTDMFVDFGNELAAKIVNDPGIDSPDSLLKASIDGETVADKVNAAINRLGENIVVKRVTRLDAGASGIAGGYVHAGGNLGVVVTLATEGSGAELETLAKDLAMHVAAADPSPIAVDRSGIDSALLDSERTIFRNQAVQSGKPEAVVEKIVEGRINKYLSEICLVEQAFVKDPDRTIGDLLRDVGAKAGAEAAVNGYQRYKLGEGDAGEA